MNAERASPTELHHKVVSQIEPVLGAARCGEILSRVASLESLGDAAELMRLLQENVSS